jgi:hypothetical protein
MEVRVRSISETPYLIRITWYLDPKSAIIGRPNYYLRMYTLKR